MLRQEMRDVVTEGSGTVLSRSAWSTPRPAPPSSARRARPTPTCGWSPAAGDIAIAAYNEVGDNGVTGAAPFIVSFLKAYDLR